MSAPACWHQTPPPSRLFLMLYMQLVYGYCVLETYSDMCWLVCGLQLHLLGYKQELGRHLSTFHNFATTFSFLSPITGKWVQHS
jgi:hypothetical protein